MTTDCNSWDYFRRGLNAKPGYFAYLACRCNGTRVRRFDHSTPSDHVAFLHNPHRWCQNRQVARSPNSCRWPSCCHSTETISRASDHWVQSRSCPRVAPATALGWTRTSVPLRCGCWQGRRHCSGSLCGRSSSSAWTSLQLCSKIHRSLPSQRSSLCGRKSRMGWENYW